MNEINELTDGKNLPELKTELDFQIKNGENEGGEICSHIKYCISQRISSLKKANDFYIDLQSKYILTSSEEKAWEKVSKELFN